MVIRTRQYLAAVVPQDEVLLLNTLRYAEEVRSTEDLGIPEKLANVKVTAKELEMALRLVDDMTEKWQPEKYKDTYREDLLARIKEKVKAGQTEEITAARERRGPRGKGADVIDLMALLKKSVEKKKPAKRAARRAERGLPDAASAMIRYAVVGLGHIAQVAVLPAFGKRAATPSWRRWSPATR